MKHYIFNATIKRTVQAERGFFLSLCFSLISGPFKKAFYSTIHLLLIEAASANKSFNSHNHHLSLQLAPIYSALFTLFCVVTLRCVDYLIFMCAWVKRKTATLCSEARQNVARRDNTNTNDGGQWEQQIGRKCSCELAWNAIDREQWLLVSQSTANHVMPECRDEFHLITQTEHLNIWVSNALISIFWNI